MKPKHDDELGMVADHIASLIKSADALNLPVAAALLKMAHLELQTVIFNINDIELRAFSETVSDQLKCH